jgi:hypothetical protein
MKSALTLFSSLIVLAACSPNYPASQVPTGTCRNQNCVVDGKPSQEYYGKFMTGQVGSCADQANMAFTSAVAQFVSPKSNTGFAEIRLFIDPTTGTYKGAYALPTTDLAAPQLQTFEGKYYLENSGIVLEGLGIGRKSTPDQMMIHVLSSSKLDVAFDPEISFVQELSPVNEKGETAAQVCAAQAAK